ncbi:unnamed protein product [Moneuplotes crassus]|uniref:F-box domain-containing protein n=1 Tax=Euplotes crassus TaxID=5936 RepID=A0AAD1XRF0_EUPCR|nr:unnamed protein product [Moneuplotes crassus]
MCITKSKCATISDKSTIIQNHFTIEEHCFTDIQQGRKSKIRREVLFLLDYIFDFLTLDELASMCLVNKFFCYVATMEKLYIKFGLVASESQISESLWSYRVSEVLATLKALNKSASSSVKPTDSNWMISSFQKRSLTKNSAYSLNKSSEANQLRISNKLSGKNLTILNRSKTFLNVSSESQFRKSSFNHGNTTNKKKKRNNFLKLSHSRTMTNNENNIIPMNIDKSEKRISEYSFETSQYMPVNLSIEGSNLKTLKEESISDRENKESNHS